MNRRMVPLMRPPAGTRSKTLARTVPHGWLVCLALVHLTTPACQLEDGRDPDRAPDNGLNPVTPEQGATPDKQNSEGSITPGVTALCEFELALTPRAQGAPGAVLEVVPPQGVVLERILLADPSATVYMRATLPITEAGLYTVEVTDAADRSCYANFEIASLEQDAKVTVAPKSE